MKSAKKTLLMVFFIIISIFLVNSFTNHVLADDYSIDYKHFTVEENIDSRVGTLGSNLSTTLIVGGAIISVIAIMILGLKYIFAGATEKAEYMKHMLPIMVGIILMGGIVSIVGLLYKIGASFNIN